MQTLKATNIAQIMEQAERKTVCSVTLPDFVVKHVRALLVARSFVWSSFSDSFPQLFW